MQVKNNILILGGGLIGSYIAALCGYAENDFRIVDSNPEHHLKDAPFFIAGNGIEDPEKFVDSQPFTAVINTIPCYDSAKVVGVVDACARHSTPYIDITEDVHVGEAIKAYCDAQNPDVPVIPHCGLAPGLVSILAAKGCENFDEVDKVSAYVGALPTSVSNRLKYNVTWSVDGVVNEYIKPVTYRKNGEMVTTDEPFSGLHSVIVNGVNLEAFRTSGGFATFINSNRAKNIEYYTLRYHGHADECRRLIATVGVDGLREELANTTVMGYASDHVLIYVTMSGKKNGKTYTDSFSKIVSNVPGMLSIQAATSMVPMVVADLVTKQILPNGFNKLEDLPFDAIQANRWFASFMQS